MIEGILLAASLIGLGCLFAGLVWFVCGTIWIRFGPQPKERRY